MDEADDCVDVRCCRDILNGFIEVIEKLFEFLRFDSSLLNTIASR
jgi:hypothetical protein